MSETVLITGGAGFFGGILKRFLLERGFFCLSIDLEPDNDSHERLVSVQGDIRDTRTLDNLFDQNRIEAVFHCAAMLAHEVRDKTLLWQSNVKGTRNIAEMCRVHGVSKVIYTSSNCLWGKNFGRPVTEDDLPEPVEIYGKSKWEGEKILQSFSGDFHSVVFRCPTIIDAGRIGLLGILFEFIREGKKVWVVGDGSNRYQFVYAGDLVRACVCALDYQDSDVFNIGSDTVPSLRETYEHVISCAGTSARVACLPKAPTVFLMKLAYVLGLSPLGPYQYGMISEDFIFDTSKIKKVLGWSPTMTNERMLQKAYEFYIDNLGSLDCQGLSAHRRSAKMGIIRLLKAVS